MPPARAQDDPPAKTAISDKFTIPMNFEVKQDFGRELPPRFDYSVEDNEDLVIPEKRIATRAFRPFVKETQSGVLLVMQWPAVFLSRGRIAIVSGNDELQGWSFNSAELESETIKTEAAAAEVAVLSKELKLSRGDVKDLEAVGRFSICISNKENNYNIKFCLDPMKFVSGQLQSAESAAGELEVKVNSQKVLPRGTISMHTFDETLTLNVRYPNGAAYEVEARPRKIEILEVRQEKEMIFVRGRGGPPMGTEIKPVEDTLHEWWTLLEPKKPVLKVMGEGEIPFVHELYFFKALPTEKDRPYLHHDSRISTYEQSVVVIGNISEKGTKVFSTEEKIKGNPETGIFKWQVDNLKRGELQKRGFEARTNSFTYYPYKRFFRGFAYEVGLRLTGIADTTDGVPKLLMHGEFAGGAWFERIYSDNYWLSLRRWGFYGRYFLGFNGTGESKYSLAALDLKYRFTPGVWNEDESFGLILGTARFSQNSVYVGPLMGVGLFWGRKMPEFFDQVFNIIPWFRYPKWVDADFVYYPVNADSKSTLNQAYKLNFHGKMMITPRWFLEAGFGIMSFAWQYQATKYGRTEVVSRNVFMSYGTGGVGLNF